MSRTSRMEAGEYQQS